MLSRIKWQYKFFHSSGGFVPGNSPIYALAKAILLVVFARPQFLSGNKPPKWGVSRLAPPDGEARAFSERMKERFKEKQRP